VKIITTPATLHLHEKETPSCCCPKHNNDGDPISLSQRHTIKPPHLCFSTCWLFTQGCQGNRAKGGYKACDRETESETERWRKRKGGGKVEREETRALLGGQRSSVRGDV